MVILVCLRLFLFWLVLIFVIGWNTENTENKLYLSAKQRIHKCSQMTKNKYGHQMHSTYAYYCWAYFFMICFSPQTLWMEWFAFWAGYGPLGILPHSLDSYCSFAITRVFMLLCIQMIFLSWLALNMLRRELKTSGALCWFILANIYIFPSLNSTSRNTFLL